MPVYVNNAIYASDQQGYIYEYEPSDGAIIKSYNLKTRLNSGIAVAADVMIVSSWNGYLIAVDKLTSKIKWKSMMSSVSFETPQISGDMVIVKTNDGMLSSFDLNDGKIVWIYQRQPPPLTLLANNTFLTVANDIIFTGMPNAKLILLNAHNGSSIWELTIASAQGVSDIDKLIDIASRPVIDDKEVCAATFNAKLACFDAISSNMLWDKNFSTVQGMVLDQNNVYAVAIDGVISAFNKNNGTELWHNATLQYRNLSTPAILNNKLLTVDDQGYAHLFNLDNGIEVARIHTPLKNGVSLPLTISSDQSVIFQSANGYLVALD